ncbi:MAG TPA: GNAT family N-acetyltransferase [Candidatus Pygmaiobacter gallistercoris]|nr:GNAT family N-acetyltransferase [Candidatus Pygmaiobacter gallistercoris]
MRKAEERDRAALQALWQQAFGDDAAFVDFVLDRFAGLENIFLTERAGEVAAFACAVPVTLGRLRGIYLYGVNTRADLRGQGIMRELLGEIHADAAARGLDFAVLVPEGEKLFGFYEKLGYQTLFYHRIVEKEIRPNLWAQAEFDTLTAPRLAAAREKFLEQPYIAFEGGAHAAMVQNLYTDGATTVQTEEGYGVFFTERETLVFRELAASGNRAATRILEAARQQTGCDKARLELPRYGEVFLGEGKIIPYGMLYWLRGERKLDGEPNMSLMCD